MLKAEIDEIRTKGENERNSERTRRVAGARRGSRNGTSTDFDYMVPAFCVQIYSTMNTHKFVKL